MREELRLTAAAASKLMSALKSEGYIEPSSSKGFYECTMKASTLASATMTPPLRSDTASRLLKEVVHRAQLINGNDEYAFRVRRIELFGSVLRGTKRPSDVDLAVTLEPKHHGDAQQKAERKRVLLARRGGRRFSNMVDELVWPRTEVLRALRNRARGLSFSEGDAPSRLGAQAELIFDASP